MSQNDVKTDNKNSHAKIGLLGRVLIPLIVIGSMLLFVVAFTNIHREGMFGYIFQWFAAVYFLGLAIGVLVYLFKNWKDKKWYAKIFYLLAGLLSAFMSLGYFTNSFLDLSYVSQPLSAQLSSIELDSTFHRESADYLLIGRDSVGKTHEFQLNSLHYDEAKKLQEQGELDLVNVRYLPNTRVLMEIKFN